MNDDKLPQEILDAKAEIEKAKEEAAELLGDNAAEDVEQAAREVEQYVKQLDGAARSMGYKDREELLELMKQRDFRGVPPDHMVPSAQRFGGVANRQVYKTKRKPSKRKNK